MTQEEIDNQSKVLADLFLRVVAIENILKQKNVITEHDINSEINKISQELISQIARANPPEKNAKE